MKNRKTNFFTLTKGLSVIFALAGLALIAFACSDGGSTAPTFSESAVATTHSSAAMTAEGSLHFEAAVVISTGKRAIIDIADMDLDGDIDVVSGIYSDDNIIWYENSGSGFGAPNSSEHLISTKARRVQSIYAADIDGDRDMDLLSADAWDIAWYENSGSGFGTPNSSEHFINASASGQSINSTDMDSDGDMDVLTVYDGKIVWYENSGSGFEGNNTRHLISYTVWGPYTAFASDMDGDDDMDVVAAFYSYRHGGKIYWFENSGNGFPRRWPISIYIDHRFEMQSIFIADMDGDGDMDVLSANREHHNILWYENSGSGFGAANSSKHIISTETRYPLSARGVDMDGDEDLDVLAASAGDDTIAWYENNGSGFGTPNSSKHIISKKADGAHSARAADLDGDGDMDVLAVSFNDYTVAWYENAGSPNAAPEISAIANRVTDEDTPSTVTFTISDDNTAAADLIVTAASDNTALVPAENLILSGTGANRTLKITPATNKSGNTKITVTVSDGEFEVTETFTLTVNSVNEPPTAAAGADQAVEATGPAGATVRLDGSASSDPNGGALTYSWSEDGSEIATGSAPDVTLGVGSHEITLTVTDPGGASDTDVVTVDIVDTTPPQMILQGANPLTLEAVIDPYTELGATASDLVDGNLTGAILIDATDINAAVPGTYIVLYSVSDAAGNRATAERTVKVVDTTPPQLTLLGDNPVTLEAGMTTYTELGATASDLVDDNLTDAIIIDAADVNAKVPGTYIVLYSVSDAAGNRATTERTVKVVDTIAPVITVGARPATVWPPNHRYHSFALSSLRISVSDAGDPGLSAVDVIITSVESDEPENGRGDGNTVNDIRLGSDCRNLQLRAERQGNGNGRVYTINLTATDASGNTGSTIYKVLVPKSKKKGAADSGTDYIVEGQCR